MIYAIKTQLIGIIRSKKLVCTLLFAPVIFLFCSFNAENANFPASYVLILFAGLITMLSSEILHWLTIDEIKDGIFDIMLISPLPKWRLLISKLFVPAATGAGMAFFTLFLNNLITRYFHFAVWQFSMWTTVLLLFSACFFAVLEFITLLITRKRNTSLHFFLLALGACATMGLFYLIELHAYYVFIAIITVLLASGVYALFRLLKSNQRIISDKQRYVFPNLYSAANLSPLRALFGKNLSVLRLYRFSALQLVTAALAPVLVACLAFLQPNLPFDIFLIFSFAAIPCVSNIYLVFYSFLYENRSKANDMLRIIGVTPIGSIAEKAVAAWIVSCALCIGCCIATSLFLPLSIRALLLMLASNFVSSLICGILSFKVNSFKGENIYKALISVIVLAVHCIVVVLV